MSCCHLVLPSEVMMDADGDQPHELLCCEERLPSSPGFPTSDSYMEYGTQTKNVRRVSTQRTDERNDVRRFSS